MLFLLLELLLTLIHAPHEFCGIRFVELDKVRHSRMHFGIFIIDENVVVRSPLLLVC